MAPRNGFYRFKQMKQREPAMTNLSEAEVMAECDRLWRAMTIDERNAFGRHGVAAAAGSDVAARKSSAAMALEKKRREEAEMEQKEKDILDMSKRSPLVEPHVDLTIIIMEMNFWITGDLGDGTQEAIPAEIGLIEMTVKKGVQRAQSWIVHHGEISPSFRLKCQKESDLGHMLPLSSTLDGDTTDLKDYMRPQADANEILEEILQFVGDAKKVFVVPALYKCSHHIKYCTLGLEFLCGKAGRDYDTDLKNRLEIYDLAKIFYESVYDIVDFNIREREEKKGEKKMTEAKILEEIRSQWPSYQTANVMFWDEFRHAFTPGVACPEFHADLDVDNKCCAGPRQAVRVHDLRHRLQAAGHPP